MLAFFIFFTVFFVLSYRCNEARPRERSHRGRLLPLDKKAFSYRGAYRVPLFKESACVCQCMCKIRCVLLIARAVRGHFHTTGIYGNGRVWGNAWGVFRRAPSQGGRGRRAAVDFVVCFGWGGYFVILFSTLFSLNALGVLQV